MDKIENQAIPALSGYKYQRVYDDFQAWKGSKEVQELSENMILEYFNQHSRNLKPTSLWAYYSMLKAKLKLHDNVDISSFHKVTDFLKTKSTGYVSVKARFFTKEQIERFISDAPDDVYLAVKVVCIFAVCGALRTEQLTRISVEHVERHGELYLVRISQSTGKKRAHVFTITGRFFEVVQKYASLRSPRTIEKRFFVNYRNGKCTIQVIGRNKFAKMAEQMAAYLMLPEPRRYTGFSFRKSSIQNSKVKENSNETSTNTTSTAGTVTETNSPLDSIAVVKCEPLDEDICNTNESFSNDDWFSNQQVNCKTVNTTSDTRQMYKCEQCGHMNRITPPTKDGLFDNNRSVENSSLVQASIDPLSLELTDKPLSFQS